MKRGFQVKALGEIAIRCENVDEMMKFYRDIIGLEVLSGKEGDAIVFFRISPGHGGHTTALALFARDAGRTELHAQSHLPPTRGERSSLHHIALTVDFSEQDAIMDWYRHHGLTFRVQQFDWIGWRGVFTEDPEGNTVELVAYSPTMLAN